MIYLLLIINILILGGVYIYLKGKYNNAILLLKEENEDSKREFISRSASINRGFDYEKIAPHLKGFPFNPKDMIFFGQPIDYICFELNEDGLYKIHVIDIKTGNARLTKTQKGIKNAVKHGDVYFHEVRITDDGVDKIKTHKNKKDDI